MERTLCWDCRCSTTGECRWSRKLKPVKGWVAEEKCIKDGIGRSFLVRECPEFVRNSWGGGTYRTEIEYLKATEESKKNREKKGGKKMNKLTIIGNLTRDPELRTTSSGTNVCDFTVAVNRRETDSNGNQLADFFRVSAWRQLGENCAKFLAKGRKVCVVGPVSVRTYTNNNGETKASMEITAQDVEFLSPKADGPVTSAADRNAGFTAVETDELPFG